jgi:TolA-binding protein
MTRRISRKEMKTDEFVETAVEASHWLEENWQQVVKGAVALAVIGAIVGFVFWYRASNRKAAEELLAKGIQVYQQAETNGFADSAAVEEALQTFSEAADRGGSAAAGSSARYFQGASLIRLGRAEEAVPVLEELTDESLTPTLAWSAEALYAEALAGAGQLERATEVLEGMAASTDASYPPGQALLQLARLQRRAGNAEQARQLLQRVTEEYPQSAAAMEAGQMLAAP